MPLSFDYILVDVFTDRPFGGNPLAVFPDAADLATSEMQALAHELNLSETTFVTPPPVGQDGHTVRIFTPLSELPFAGHPTIGTALALDSLNDGANVGPSDQAPDLMLLHEPIGVVAVRILRGRGASRAVLTSPRNPEMVAPAPDTALLARLLGLDTADLLDEAVRPLCYSAGVPFTFIPVRDRERLSRVRLDGAVWKASFAGGPAPHIYVLAMSDWHTGRKLDARMFAPAMGIPEDPATGVAAAALGGYLATFQTLPPGTTEFTIRQGVDMGRPSQLDLSLDIVGGQITEVRVGGSAVIIGHGSILRSAFRR